MRFRPAISGAVEDLYRDDQRFYSRLILKAYRSTANMRVSFLVKLEVALKTFIRAFYLPPGPLDSQLTLAIDHIYIVWKDKLKRSVRFIVSILGIDYGRPVARCSILRLEKKLLLDISQGNFFGSKHLISRIKSNSLMLPKCEKLHLAMAENAYIDSKYGAFNAQGIPFDGAFFVRAGIFVNGVPEKALPPNKSSCTNVDTAFFVNELNLSHFGHSITDGLSSVLPLLLLADMRITPKIPIIINKQISRQKSDLLKVFDSSDLNILVPGKNCGNLVVKNLFYAVPTMVNSGRLKGFGFVSESHPILVKKYLSKLPESGGKKNFPPSSFSKKIYLSRSHLQKNQRQFIDESRLEQELIRLGWFICHPQEYSLRDQLYLLGSAARLCGVQGSALHLLFGIDPNPDLLVTILAPLNCNSNYRNQMKAQGINHKIINCLDVAQGQDDKPPWLRDQQLISGWKFVSLAMRIDGS